MSQRQKKKFYLVNGFTLIIKNISSALDYEIVEFFPIGKRFLTVRNFLEYFLRKVNGSLKRYDIIHINTWETFLLARKNKGQIIIGESHGFHFGLNFLDTLQHFHGIKKIIARLVEFLIGWLIRRSIKKSFDIYYVSTPNMLEHTKKLRIDTKWLPNCLNTDIFQEKGEKEELLGNPAIFYPTRLHSFKNPKFGINLFRKIKKVYPDAVLHLIRYPHGEDPLAKYYEGILKDQKTYVWHSFKTKDELARMYRGAKIVFGHFHPNLGMLSQVELEAIACKTAVISYDKFEIKTPLDSLEKLCFQLLENPDFYKEFTEKNSQIVLEKHSRENVAKMLTEDIDFIKMGFQILPLSQSIISKNIKNITEIEREVFSEVGVWGEKEFLFETPHKFESSFCIMKDSQIVAYILGTYTNKDGYINRVAVSKKFQGYSLGKRILEYFEENLKFICAVEKIHLVTHQSLGVDAFYVKSKYNRLEEKNEIEKFLIKKDKQNHFSEYYGEEKFMNIYYKHL